ncbi:alpha-mannosyltransferase [Niveomyces insectorum RCEF 264]|uniref:Alpha-mannosyltransferase n=1 Tax=Niveomyces insectorum RCEF 264 TaxID=1081102 RepID=A0A167YMP7_9HYPO|nr:alpha-mannosyltransferase [Niveomyces insectorum RCEF 264]
MSLDSTRSSSLLEKLTPPGSPKTPASAFASTTAKFRSRLPTLPDWVPSQTAQAVQAAQAALLQLHAALSPHITHYYQHAAAALPPVSALAVPVRLRRLATPYSLMFLAILVVFNIGMFRSGSPDSYTRTNHKAFAASAPNSVRSDFPHKIWQTWKVNPLEFENRDHDTARSWLDRNPDYRYEVLTDGNELPYVEYHFGPEGFNRPDIVDFYRNVRATIVRADLLRYMIMFAEGGVYADIDVEAIKPMSRFIPDRYNVKDIDMVIGVEIDEPDWRDHPILGPKSRSFCQWTFMSKPQMPIMMKLIEQIMTWLHGVARKQKVSISDVVLDFDEIITGTGPSAFTNAILDYINEQRPTDNPVNWDYFHDMSESKLVSGVLVLTVEAFAAGQGHSDSGNHDARAALVRHHYHASNWPSRHPRYKHPVYGEVENCNWRDDCVRQWDEDVEAFKHLSGDEQRRLIEEHEREEKEKAEKAEEERARKQQEEEEERRRQEEAEEAEAEERKQKDDEDARKDEEQRESNDEREREADGQKKAQ